jgi:hypothetical protein
MESVTKGAFDLADRSFSREDLSSETGRGSTARKSYSLRSTPSKENTMHSDRTTNIASAAMKQAGSDNASFKLLQKKVYEIIQAWASQPSSRAHKFYSMWTKRWPDQVTERSTLHIVKQKVGITLLLDYYNYIVQCPAIQERLDLHFNHKTNKIVCSEKQSTSSPTQLVLRKPQVSKATDILPDVTLSPNDAWNVVPGSRAVVLDSIQEEQSNSTQPDILAINLDGSPEEVLAEASGETTNFSVQSSTTGKIMENEILKQLSSHTQSEVQEDTETTIVIDQEDVFHLVDAASSPQSNSENFSSDDAFSEKFSSDDAFGDMISDLRLDIEEEAAEDPASTHINRFLHHFRDQYNAKMGVFGHYLTTARQEISSLVSHADNKLNLFKDQLQAFEQCFTMTVKDADTKTENMEARVNYLNDIINQRVDTAGLRINQHVIDQQNKFLQLLKEVKTQQLSAFSAEIDAAVLQSINEKLQSYTTSKISDIEQIGSDMMESLDTLFRDLKTELRHQREEILNS